MAPTGFTAWISCMCYYFLIVNQLARTDMKKSRTFMAGILSGLAPAPLSERGHYPSLQGTDTSRMRGDVVRVGKQFSTVIDRENGKKVQSARPEARSK